MCSWHSQPFLNLSATSLALSFNFEKSGRDFLDSFDFFETFDDSGFFLFGVLLTALKEISFCIY